MRSSRNVSAAIVAVCALLLLGAGTPAPAHAQAAAAATDLCASSVPSGASAQPTNFNGAAFGCVVRGLYGDAGSGHGARLILTNMKSMCDAVFFLAFLAELAWLVLFGTIDSSYGAGASGVPMHLYRHLVMTAFFGFLLSMYPLMIDSLASLAIAGSGVAQTEFQNAMSTPAADPTAMASMIPAQQEADQTLAQYLSLKADTTVSANPVKQAQLDSLSALVSDTTTCFAKLLPSGVAVSDPSVTAQTSQCRLIAQRKPLYAATFQQVQNIVGQGQVTAGDFLSILWGGAETVAIKVMSSLLGTVLTVITAAISGLVGLAWILMAVVGMPLVALLPFRKAAGLGQWWFKGIFALTLVPVILSLCMALWWGTNALIIAQAPGSIVMGLLSQFIGLTIVALGAIGGYSALQQLGGGVVQAASMVGKAAVTAGASMAASGVTAGVGAFNSTGGSVGQKLGAAAKAGTKAVATDYGRQTAAMAGLAAGTLTGNTDQRSLAESSASSAVNVGAARVGRAGAARATSAWQAMRTGKGTMEKPGAFAGSTKMMQANEEAKAGSDLATQLSSADGDYNTQGNGQLALTPQGQGKVQAYRTQNSAAFRATAGLTPDQLVNRPGVRNRINGTHQDPLDGVLGPNTGSPERTIASELPAAITRARPGESTAQQRQRVQAEAGRIRQQAGDSWKAAERSLASVNDVAGRSVTESDGKRYGIEPDDVSTAVPAAQRRYSAMRGSAFDMYATANPNRSQDQAYNAVKTAVQARTPQLPAESPDEYMHRVHESVFTI